MSAVSASGDRFSQLDAAVTRGHAAEAEALAAIVRSEYLPAHDGLRDTVGAILDFAVRATSPEEGEAVGRDVIERMMGGADGDPPQYAQEDLRERVRAIAAGWHWHGTTFTVVEDDEKITFRLDPCGSGMRLMLEGAYDGERGWRRSVDPSPSTFMQVEFPLYSNHCAEMTRAALRTGSSTFLVEGWTPLRECGVCLQHTFKRTQDVPAEFYRRVGLEPPGRADADAALRSRLFTDAELEAIATHPLERMNAALRFGDREAAHAAIDESRAAWRDSMHGAYVRWISQLWAELERRLGHQHFLTALEETAPAILGHVLDADAEGWTAFWSIHLGLRECQPDGAGLAFTVERDALLDLASFPGSAEEFCAAIEQGLAVRNATHVGSFSASDETIVHRWPGPRGASPAPQA